MKPNNNDLIPKYSLDKITPHTIIYHSTLQKNVNFKKFATITTTNSSPVPSYQLYKRGGLGKNYEDCRGCWQRHQYNFTTILQCCTQINHLHLLVDFFVGHLLRLDTVWCHCAVPTLTCFHSSPCGGGGGGTPM